MIAIGILFVAKYFKKTLGEDDPSIRISGNIEVIDAEVNFKIAGRVEARLVDEGEIVKQGQLVARLVKTELNQEVASSEAEGQLFNKLFFGSFFLRAQLYFFYTNSLLNQWLITDYCKALFDLIFHAKPLP